MRFASDNFVYELVRNNTCTYHGQGSRCDFARENDWRRVRSLRSNNVFNKLYRVILK